jgi:hypothetical protein
MTVDAIHPPSAEAPPNGNAKPAPAEAAALLADFVEVLIPGEGDWPSASTAGVQALLAVRLFEDLGRGHFARLATAIIAAGGPFAGRSEEERVAIVQRFEAADPALFGWVRDAAYIAYYENPFVAAVINAQGHPYDVRPHLKGYPLAPFDVEHQTPRHGRGHFIATSDVRRIDTSTLDLETERTQAWGLKR